MSNDLYRKMQAVEQDYASVDKHDALNQALADCHDIETLRQLWYRHYPDYAVINVLQRLNALRPHSPDILAALAHLYAMYLRPEEAQRFADSALGIDPANVEAMYVHLAHALGIGNEDDALAWAEALLGRDPFHHEATLATARILAKRGDSTTATVLLRRYIDHQRREGADDLAGMAAEVLAEVEEDRLDRNL